MEPGKWKQALGGLLQKEKAVKLVVLLGICGIALIGLSSFWEPSGQQDAPAESSVPAADYRGELEESLCRIVTARSCWYTEFRACTFTHSWHPTV